MRLANWIFQKLWHCKFGQSKQRVKNDRENGRGLMTDPISCNGKVMVGRKVWRSLMISIWVVWVAGPDTIYNHRSSGRCLVITKIKENQKEGETGTKLRFQIEVDKNKIPSMHNLISNYSQRQCCTRLTVNTAVFAIVGILNPYFYH